MHNYTSFFLDNPYVYYSLMGIYALTVIVILMVVISENRNPVKSLAWITVLLLMPGVGIVLYMFFGRSIKNTRMISRRNRRRLKRVQQKHKVDPSRLGLSEQSRSLVKLAYSLSGAIYHVNNNVEIFTNGKDKFDALKKDISTARQYILIQYYIFSDDKIGQEIAQLLIDQARKGVKVCVIYDHVGSLHTKNRFFKRMRKAGVKIYPFFKVTFPPFGTRINWRNHRKICVIDGKVGYIGGMNIADRYVEGDKLGTWRDTHLRVTGTAVTSLLFSFAVDWNFMGQPLIDSEVVEIGKPVGDMGIQLMTSGPTSQWSNVAMMFHHAIVNSKKRVYLQTPYFLPTEGLLKALCAAALAKVDVRIMIPRRSYSRTMTYASCSYITECLRAGIKFYFYDGGMLHSKTLVIDDEFSSVGSTNFDFRSFEHNFESNLFIYSRELNSKMADIFMQDLNQSTRVFPSEWKKRPRHVKIAESLLRLLSPIL